MTRRILLIEDEPLSQDIITSLLRGQGYAVDVATDGFAALDRSRSVSYDVALVDYHLPEMDGYTLGRLLREQHPGEAAGPVLIGLTADSNGLAARRGSDAVFRAILPKPIKPADLFSTIERLCETAAPATERWSSEKAPDLGETRRAAAALWRTHGLASPPKAFASPPPSSEQAAALSLCFELVEADASQCILLLERHGINQALRAARRGQGAPLPIIGLSADHADICDILFRVDDATTWKGVACALGVQRPAASVVTLPTPRPFREPEPSIVHPAASAPVPAPAASAERALGEAVASDIRTLLLEGVRTPLDRLRRDISAGQRTLGAAEERQASVGWLAALDSVLLVADTIADAVNADAPRAGEASVFDPFELAQNAAAMIRDSLPPGFARVSCRHANALPPLLRGDAHRLSQAVLTLLDDACAGPEPVTLTLQLAFEAEQGTLTVGLTQAGEPPETTVEPGVVALLRKLRLTMLGRLVKLMGGTLVREAGETRLSVPALAEAPTSRLHPEGEADAAGEPARILLIDDGATSGQLLTLLLTRKGHHICRVGDAEAALVACRQAQHDLIVFDLPTGEAARQASIDAVGQFRTAQGEAPVLVLAADVSPSDEERLRASGVARLLAKPIAPEALDAAVAACRKDRAALPHATPDIIDAGVRDALTQALGVAAVERLTGQLLAQIEALVAEPALRDEAKSRLIELSGCACVLGLSDLAASCARPTDDGAMASALRRLRERSQTLELSAA